MYEDNAKEDRENLAHDLTYNLQLYDLQPQSNNSRLSPCYSENKYMPSFFVLRSSRPMAHETFTDRNTSRLDESWCSE